MSTALPTLADLRRRIDELDDALHDILIERAAIVESVATLKQRDATPPLRPGREAQIIHRLLARHRGAFPKATLVRLWRELLAGTISIQVDLQIAVYAPENVSGLWDLARDHYGSQTAMSGFRSSGEVLRALGDGRAMLGVLPMPGQREGDAWWRFLAGGDAPVLRVIARLPFGARGNARTDVGDAFVVAAIEPEESGADRSLFLIEIGDDISRARLLTALNGIGIPATGLAVVEAEGGVAALLIEFDGWLAADDVRLKDTLAALGDKARSRWLGAYARPLNAAELGK
jgi:chorismate mutase/prephenate dehydratase